MDVEANKGSLAPIEKIKKTTGLGVWLAFNAALFCKIIMLFTVCFNLLCNLLTLSRSKLIFRLSNTLNHIIIYNIKDITKLCISKRWSVNFEEPPTHFLNPYQDNTQTRRGISIQSTIQNEVQLGTEGDPPAQPPIDAGKEKTSSKTGSESELKAPKREKIQLELSKRRRVNNF